MNEYAVVYSSLSYYAATKGIVEISPNPLGSDS